MGRIGEMKKGYRCRSQFRLLLTAILSVNAVSGAAAMTGAEPVFAAARTEAASDLPQEETAEYSGGNAKATAAEVSEEITGSVLMDVENPGENAGAAVTDAGLLFDLNKDAATTQADYELAADWLKIYALSGETEEGDSISLNNNDEASESLRKIILQLIGVPGTGSGQIEYDTQLDVDSLSAYTIYEDGLGTAAGSQGAYGICWAFASNAAIESQVIRERLSLLEGTSQGLDLTDPVNLISNLYLGVKAFRQQDSGSQAGEGLILRDANSVAETLMAGGFLSMAEVVYGNWDGPVSEETEQYDVPCNSGDGVLHAREDEDGTGKEAVIARLQDYYIYDSAAVTIEDPETQLRIWQYYDETATRNWKNAILEYGALAVMCATDTESPDAAGRSDFTNYSTWMQYYSEDVVLNNHAVTIVGWDDSVPAQLFSEEPQEQPPGDGAWLVKNSWGSYYTSAESYGEEFIDRLLLNVQPDTKAYYLIQRSYNYGIPDENGHGSGFFWISYYDKSLSCAAAAAGVDIAEDGWDYDNNYTYQYAVNLTNAALVLPAGNEETSVCNVFTADGDELLLAVSAEAAASNMTAEIRIYVFDSDAEEAAGEEDNPETKAGQASNEVDEATVFHPEDGTLAAAWTAELAEAGLHTLELDAPIELEEGQTFAVVEKISSETGEGETITWLNLETVLAEELQTQENYSGCLTTVTANEGETYAWVALADGTFGWVTPAQLNESDSGTIVQYGNALIHAYTVDR